MVQLSVPRQSITASRPGTAPPFEVAARKPDCTAKLEQLYRCERPRLLAWLTRHVGAEQARDLAQEVFVRAAMSDQIMQLQNPGGFLFRIARNLVIDEGRRQKCRIRPLPLYDGIDAGHTAEQENYLNAAETAEVFKRAMAQLPETTARIFAMNRFEKKTYRDIHEELRISLATVDYHMMKALAHLRDRMIDCR